MQKTVPRAYSDHLEVETKISLQSNKSDKGLFNNCKVLRNTIIDLMLPQEGDTILLPQRIRLHLRHHEESSAESLVEKEEPDFFFKSISESKELHKMSSWKKWFAHEIFSWRFWKTRKLSEIQRGIKSHNSWNGQHRVVRVGTDVQNRPVPFMLETLVARISVLFLWRFSLSWWRINKKRSIPSFHSPLSSCTSESLKGQEARRDSVTTRPSESNGSQKRSMETQQGHHCNQVTRRWNV